MSAESTPIAVTFDVTSEDSGERLDVLVSRRVPGMSRAQAQVLIAAGRVELAGQVVRASTKGKLGMRVDVRPLPPPPSAAAPEDLPLEVLHEDPFLVVLVKAAGMVVHPAAGHAGGTLVNALRFRASLHTELEPDATERPGIVHRLDKDTSGVMVVAKTVAAREGLIAQFQAHDLERAYVAIVQGQPQSVFSLDTLHGRHPVDRKRFSTRVTRGRRAVTHVRVLESLHASSLVECRLETGRTHQIRVHLAEHGYPVLADPMYGRSSRDPRVARAAELVGRQALHARTLGFRHPITAERMLFEAPPPADFETALAHLRGATAT
jgi:23S rRNA pseudouridine1911/1915/1917 synthase